MAICFIVRQEVFSHYQTKQAICHQYIVGDAQEVLPKKSKFQYHQYMTISIIFLEEYC